MIERDLLHQCTIARVTKDAPREGAEISSLPAKILQRKPPIALDVGRDFGLGCVLNTDLPTMIQHPSGHVDVVRSVYDYMINDLMRESICKVLVLENSSTNEHSSSNQGPTASIRCETYRLVVIQPEHIERCCSFPGCDDFGILALRWDLRAFFQSVISSHGSLVGR